jgi:hypothetical protein
MYKKLVKNCFCNGVNVKSEDSDNDKVVKEFKSNGFKSDKFRSKFYTSKIGELLYVIEGVINKEFVVKKGIESAVDNSYLLLF